MSGMDLSSEQLAAMRPSEFRSLVRKQQWKTHTADGICRGYLQANLAIVPQDIAYDFLLFCLRNPGPCPVIDVTEVGNPCPDEAVARGADLRTDVPRYCIYRNGVLVDEPYDISSYWRDDFVAFLLGCSLSFDWLLKEAGVQYRMTGAYVSSIRCKSAGLFSGPMVVSCRLMKSSHDAVRAVQISSRIPAAHGAPVHIGDPAAIGIADLCQPLEKWEVAPQKPGEVAMFWACGITPQLAAMEAKLPVMISHRLAHMFVTDIPCAELMCSRSVSE